MSFFFSEGPVAKWLGPLIRERRASGSNPGSVDTGNYKTGTLEAALLDTHGKCQDWPQGVILL